MSTIEFRVYHRNQTQQRCIFLFDKDCQSLIFFSSYRDITEEVISQKLVWVFFGTKNTLNYSQIKCFSLQSDMQITLLPFFNCFIRRYSQYPNTWFSLIIFYVKYWTFSFDQTYKYFFEEAQILWIFSINQESDINWIPINEENVSSTNKHKNVRLFYEFLCLRFSRCKPQVNNCCFPSIVDKQHVL